MATCKVVRQDPPPPNKYQLTLSQDEAETLMIISHNIGGAEVGRRGHNSSIQDALREAGIEDQYNHPDLTTGNHGIYFQDTIRRKKG